MSGKSFFDSLGALAHVCPHSCADYKGKTTRPGRGEKHSPLLLRDIDLGISIRLSLAAILFLLGILLPVPETVKLLLLAASSLVSGYDILLGAVLEIGKKRFFDGNLILTLAAAAAFLIGRPYEGAAVWFLFRLGELFLDYAKKRTGQSVEELMHTGSDAAAGHKVRGGTPVGQAEPDAASENTHLAALAEAAAVKEGSTQVFLNRLARILPPAAVGLAVLLSVLLLLLTEISVSDAVHRALAIWVIAGPCTLLASAFPTFFAGIGGAATRGILFNSTAALDAMAEIKAAVFDKNGTLSLGRFRVIAAKSERMEADLLLKVAAHALSGSTLPFAKAIVYAYGGSIQSELVREFKEYPDGVRVLVNDIPILVGGREFLLARNVDAEADDGAELVIYMAVDGNYAGRLLLSDTVREGAADVIRELADTGAEHIALLTSDSREIGARFAKAAGIGEYCSECGPEDKAAYIQKMKERVPQGSLIFIGDAAGNTPLPTAADADVVLSADGGALDSPSDVVVLNGDPAGAASAVYTARSIRRIVWENTVFILLIKAVIIALSAAGISSQMWFAVIADMSAAMAAVLNSFRAFRMPKPGR